MFGDKYIDMRERRFNGDLQAVLDKLLGLNKTVYIRSGTGGEQVILRPGEKHDLGEIQVDRKKGLSVSHGQRFAIVAV